MNDDGGQRDWRSDPKRGEGGTFHFPAAADGQAGVSLRAAALAMQLDGVERQDAQRSKRYHRPAAATG